jgi:hypothetical protein
MGYGKLILSLLSNGLAMFTSVFKAKNETDVRDRAKAQQKIDEKAKIEKAVNEGDDEEYRKQIG